MIVADVLRPPLLSTRTVVPTALSGPSLGSPHSTTATTQHSVAGRERQPRQLRHRRPCTSTPIQVPVFLDQAAQTSGRPYRLARAGGAYALSYGVGQAIVRYLTDVRPPRPERTLFLTVRAPIHPLRPAGKSIVSEDASAVRNCRSVEEFTLERGEKALTHRVVVRVAHRAHRLHYAGLPAPLAERQRRALRALDALMFVKRAPAR